jgi:hypothetical protein
MAVKTTYRESGNFLPKVTGRRNIPLRTIQARRSRLAEGLRGGGATLPCLCAAEWIMTRYGFTRRLFGVTTADRGLAT